MKNVHLIAACGVGMASLAGMLKEKGFRVTGSDANVYPPMSVQLSALGIVLRSPYAAGNIPEDTDLVVVGNAVSRDNPEVAETARRGLPVLSMPQAVAELFLGGKESVVVAGTHGKTTVTSLLSWSLFALGADPSFLVGGIPRNFPVSYRVGGGLHFVIEGDEYDTAYFDKGPKFLHYRPRIALLTSIEFDHADIYRDLSHLKESFRKLVRSVPREGLLIASADYPGVVEVAQEAECPVWYYGVEPGRAAISADPPWRVTLLSEEGEFSRFRMVRGEEMHDFRLRLPGRHNAGNAAAAALALFRLGFEANRVAEAFAGFQGVRRRLEEVGEAGGVLVVDDFAHHPTAVRETIRAIRARHPGRTVTAVFEPRSNTSRRKVFQKEFAEALSGADSVILAGVFGAEKFSPDDRLDPEGVVASIKEGGRKALYIEEVDRIVEHLSSTSRPGDLILIMSNGGFGGIQGKLARALETRSIVPPVHGKTP
jgi:UDP-N-acetylmuramate: L-alanyl-gamma-D-glutamyl-meso-diaminopimelate ligase